MKIEFEVNDHLPPKKDGANSIWGKASEFARLVALRQAAIAARGARPPLARGITLTVDIFLPQPEAMASGDLDNFVGGICDGLMAAHPASLKEPRWGIPTLRHLHPGIVAAIKDDGAVVSIVARKLEATDGRIRYRVTLEGECASLEPKVRP